MWTSILSLYYLFKKRQKTASHLIVTGFTIATTAFNIVVIGLRIATIVLYTKATVCPGGAFAGLLAFQVSSLPSFWDLSLVNEALFNATQISYSLIPVFLWVTDAFLVSLLPRSIPPSSLTTVPKLYHQLYRAWVIWIHNRKYVLIPALVFLASISKP